MVHVTTVPLVQQRVHIPMVLAPRTRVGFKSERHVKSGVPSRLNQNQLRQCQNMLVLPNIEVTKLEHLLLKLCTEEGSLVEARPPK